MPQRREDDRLSGKEPEKPDTRRERASVYIGPMVGSYVEVGDRIAIWVSMN